MTATPPGDGDSATAVNTGAAGILAECRELYLARLADCVRRAGMADAEGLETLRHGAGEFFDSMTSQRGRAGFEQAKGLTASRISLVNDSELAISIKLGELSRHLQASNNDGNLWKLSNRLAALLGRDDFAIDDNPVGPEGVCAGLAEMCGALRCDEATATRLLEGIGSELALELPVVYAEVNELLVRRNVHPPRRARTDVRGSSAAGKSDDPLAALQQALQSRQGGQTSAAAAQIPAAQTAAAATGVATGTALPALSAQAFEAVLTRLDALQSGGGVSGDLFAGGDQGSASTTALRTIQSGEAQASLSVGQSQAIDVLTLIFDAIFADARLPDAIKVALSRLQIPVLKSIFLDSTFFHDATHPARTLLDQIGRCALEVPADAHGDHPICAQINAAATAVSAEFNRDPAIFDRQTAALETQIAQSDYRLQLATDAYIPLAQNQEKRDLAAAAAERLAHDFADATVPPVIADFLADDWPRILAEVHFAAGEDSVAWREQRYVGKDLVWSIQAKAGGEERKRLAALVPNLMRRISAGLKMIGVDAAARAPFFDACFELQTAVLRGKAPPAFAAQRRPADVAETANPIGMMQLTAGSLTLKILRGGAPSPERGIAPGTWVQLRLPDGSPADGRLCWVSPRLHLHLFGNSSWDFALLVAPQILAAQLQSGEAQLRSESSWFAEAATNALHQLQ